MLFGEDISKDCPKDTCTHDGISKISLLGVDPRPRGGARGKSRGWKQPRPHRRYFQVVGPVL